MSQIRIAAAILQLLILSAAPSQLEGVKLETTVSCRFQVEEEVPIGATIENSNLYACFGLEPVPGDRLTLTQPRGFGRGWERIRDLLTIDPRGYLKVSSRLDRESPELQCLAKNPCVKTLEVQLQNFDRPSRMRLAEFQLAILDKNDNDPSFAPGGRVLEVKENSMEQRRPVPSVTDPDAGENGRTDTRIVDSSPPGRLSVDRLDRVGTSQPFLVIGKGLDFELARGYNLTLEACDRGLQRRCSRFELQLRIQDENDNAPKFKERLYRLEPVSEDLYRQGERRLVGRVEATDADEGENARVTYAIEPGQPGAASFDIDANTGEVYLVGPLNAASDQNLEFTVRASDNGSPELWDEASVQVSVTDVNDHSPVVDLQFPEQVSGVKRPSLLENTPAPAIVSFLKVSDGDLGENGRVSCRLGRNAESFALVPPTDGPGGRLYRVNATRVYDREVQASDSFEVVCWDYGQPARTSSSTVTVDIGDVNEFPPAFNSTVFAGNSVPENRAGVFVTRVTAHDSDATARLEFAFSDEGSAKGLFAIDNRTGVIRTLRALDREDAGFLYSRPIYSVSVQVSDGGKTATAQVEIAVTDENDHAPELVGSKDLYVNETFGDSFATDVSIGRLEKEDRDDPTTANARVSFGLLGSEPVTVNLTFSVSSSGHVTATGQLDRERQSHYVLVLLLQDSGSPPMSSTASVTVSLLDVNDNAPSIEAPLPHQVIDVTDDYTPGVSIFNVRVHDADSCELQTLRLTARDCHAAAGFSMRLLQRTRILTVNSTTGELRVVNPLTPGLHAFNLTVSDRGSPKPLSTTVPFSVRVRRQDSLFAPGGFGAASNWTLLLVVVVASSFLTLVLVVAIVLLNRRQPCVPHRGYSGPKDQDCAEAEGGPYQGDQRSDCLGPLTTFGHGVGSGHQPIETLRRENGNNNCGSPAAMLHHYAGGGHVLGPPPNIFLPGDYDVASADSGHGASEEEMMHSDHRSENI